ncbi:MAG: transposase, partial [Chloroflexi bacterium]|nr:transposase [Chloroflexota bacterium]
MTRRTFVTTTLGRQPVFGDERHAQILWNVIDVQRERGRLHLLGFVIMPDHLHLVALPREQFTLSFIMQEIKKGSSRLVNKLTHRQGKIWQAHYYDHAIRSRAGIVGALNYVHHNPVRKGLAP